MKFEECFSPTGTTSRFSKCNTKTTVKSSMEIASKNLRASACVEQLNMGRGNAFFQQAASADW